MPHYFVKCVSGTFLREEQPEGFKAGLAIENRIFMCESPTPPNSEFVVELPEEMREKFVYYAWPDGKRLPFDPFNGKVKFSEDQDAKLRRAIQYTPEQLADKLDIMKWLMINVWIPDKKRMYGVPDDLVSFYIEQVNSLVDTVEARTYIEKNLFYNL